MKWVPFLALIFAAAGCLDSSHRGDGGGGELASTTTQKAPLVSSTPSKITGWPQTPSPVTAVNYSPSTTTRANSSTIETPVTLPPSSVSPPTTKPPQVLLAIKYLDGSASYTRQKGPNSSSFTPKIVGSPKAAGERQQTMWVEPSALEGSGGWGCVITSTPTEVTCDFTETLWNCSMEWHESAFPTGTINTISESWEDLSVALVAGRVTITKPAPKFSSGCKTQYGND